MKKLLCLLLVTVLALSFVSCRDVSESENDELYKAENVAKKFSTAVAMMDFADAEKYLADDFWGKTEKPKMKNLLEKDSDMYKALEDLVMHVATNPEVKTREDGSVEITCIIKTTTKKNVEAKKEFNAVKLAVEELAALYDKPNQSEADKKDISGYEKDIKKATWGTADLSDKEAILTWIHDKYPDKEKEKEKEILGRVKEVSVTLVLKKDGKGNWKVASESDLSALAGLATSNNTTGNGTNTTEVKKENMPNQGKNPGNNTKSDGEEK
ncbi:MAG: hypothetical protein IKJ55_02750 [Clostridia bacterium]|nr:hypothetical protein [Clostridia bacterium]